MLKKILLPLSCLLIAACDIQSLKPKTFHWATVDKGKIEKTFLALYKTKNPYPDDIKIVGTEVIQQKRELKEQVAQFEDNESRKCKEKIFPEIKAERLAQLERQKAGGHPEIVPDSWARDRAIENSPEYQECLAAIKQDPLYINMKQQTTKLDGIDGARSEHDRKVKAMVDTAVEQAISSYANRNGFDVIIDGRYNSYIAYNKSGTVLDVTDDIVSHIPSELPNTPQASSK